VTAPQTATAQETAKTAADQASQVGGAATSAASDVAGTAAAATGDVASTAKEQAANVVGESIEQAKDLAGQARDTVAEQLRSQSERLTGQLQSLSGQLKEGDTSGIVGQVLTEAGQRLPALADHVQQAGPEGGLADLRSYARPNPGSFLLGAAAAGLVTGRLVKGMTSGSSGSPASQQFSAPAATPVTTGLAPAGSPGVDPYPAPPAPELPATAVFPGGAR